MNIPTVCDCGEVVEFDDIRAIGKLLVCEYCYNEHMEDDEE